MGVVSLEAAKALVEVGFPQTINKRLFAHPLENIYVRTLQGDDWVLVNGEGRITMEDYFLAPDHLTALDWLERVKGYGINRIEFGGWYADCPPFPPVDHLPAGDNFFNALLTPDELIIAICERIKAKTTEPDQPGRLPPIPRSEDDRTQAGS